MIRNDEFLFAQLIWQVRRLFQRLTSESNEFLEGYGINASQRAVLEFLDHNQPETLANMARAHDVSRQHMQQIVNDLLEKGLVQAVDNPNHKRSFLVQRTESGDALFRQIKRVETTLFKAMMKEFDSDAIATCVDTLKRFHEYLHADTWAQLKRDHIDNPSLS